MEISVRLAQPSDARGIWEIRNEPASLAVAANPEVIPLAQHINWFDSKYFANKDNVCFVAELEGKIIGYSRFDLNGSHYLNSIAVVSAIHGKGIGTLLLKESVRQLKSPIPIHAKIRRHNSVSIKMFERVGFKKISEDQENFYYQLKQKDHERSF